MIEITWHQEEGPYGVSAGTWPSIMLISNQAST